MYFFNIFSRNTTTVDMDESFYVTPKKQNNNSVPETLEESIPEIDVDPFEYSQEFNSDESLIESQTTSFKRDLEIQNQQNNRIQPIVDIDEKVQEIMKFVDEDKYNKIKERREKYKALAETWELYLEENLPEFSEGFLNNIIATRHRSLAMPCYIPNGAFSDREKWIDFVKKIVQLSNVTVWNENELKDYCNPSWYLKIIKNKNEIL